MAARIANVSACVRSPRGARLQRLNQMATDTVKVGGEGAAADAMWCLTRCASQYRCTYSIDSYWSGCRPDWATSRVMDTRAKVRIEAGASFLGTIVMHK